MILFSRTQGIGQTVSGLPNFGLLLLIMRLHNPMNVKQGLPCLAYPQVSKIKLASPRLLVRHRNFNLFPFCHLVISWWLRTGLLLADKRCQENRALSGAQDSHLDLLLLTPGLSFLSGPLDLTAQLPPRQDASLTDEQHCCSSEVSAPSLAPYASSGPAF